MVLQAIIRSFNFANTDQVFQGACEDSIDSLMYQNSCKHIPFVDGQELAHNLHLPTFSVCSFWSAETRAPPVPSRLFAMGCLGSKADAPTAETKADDQKDSKGFLRGGSWGKEFKSEYLIENLLFSFGVKYIFWPFSCRFFFFLCRKWIAKG